MRWLDIVNVAWAQHQLPSGAGRSCTLWTDRTRLTGRDREPHHDRFSSAFGACRPDRVGHALRTRDALVVPVDGERGAVETATRAGLLGVVDAQRPNKGDTEVALGADE